MPYAAHYAATYPLESPGGEESYPEVYPWIAQCLQDSARELDDGYFHPEIRSALRDAIPKAAVAAAGLATARAFYSALEGDELDMVSQAVGLIVAAKLQPTLATGGAGGDLLSEGTEGVKRTFSSAATLRAEWRAEAARLLADCSFAPPKPVRPAAPVMYGANGPSRARAAVVREGRR